jgi:hypothetical protein
MWKRSWGSPILAQQEGKKARKNVEPTKKKLTVNEREPNMELDPKVDLIVARRRKKNEKYY